MRTTVDKCVSAENRIEVVGWVDSKRDHGKLTFIDIKDHTGVLQVVGRNLLRDLNLGDVISVYGEVKKRPEKMVNPNLPTGDRELVAESYAIVNKSGPLPIPTEGDGYEVSEDMRLRYRYLDLRRERLQKNLRLRSNLFHELRGYLRQYGFIEIETPLLTKSTKEGARDFIVPSRTYPGCCYALPQSPQQYKQLLMAAGFEKYYQFARCVRDEDPRADRGFEFTQLDLEMAYVNHETDILWRVEQILRAAMSKARVPFSEPKDCNTKEWESCRFQVLTYGDALEKYGTDKPDIRTVGEKELGTLAFCWVVRFPMFKPAKDAVDKIDSKSDWTFMHNPFSAPIPNNVQWLLKGDNIAQITAMQFDLVCNGLELGSGSIRSHRSDLLAATFKIMGYSDDEIKESVGHMLEAFDLGAPPHGGMALGLDRLVMLACGEQNLKEVVAFPTSTTGRTSVMDAPCEIRKDQRKELGL